MERELVGYVRLEKREKCRENTNAVAKSRNAEQGECGGTPPSKRSAGLASLPAREL